MSSYLRTGYATVRKCVRPNLDDAESFVQICRIPVGTAVPDRIVVAVVAKLTPHAHARDLGQEAASREGWT